MPPALSAESIASHRSELILDDAYQLTQLRCLGALASLLEEIRPPSQAVLVTQGDPELPLARHRAWEAPRDSSRQLALDADETRELAAFNGKHLSEETLELSARADGGLARRDRARLAHAGRICAAEDVAQTISGANVRSRITSSR